MTYPSPGRTSGTMRGYLVQPAAQGPFPAVLVIHEPSAKLAWERTIAFFKKHLA